ncbi:MAG: XdhC/CoxI family protein, partial [Oscillospiraceae bacterium]
MEISTDLQSGEKHFGFTADSALLRQTIVQKPGAFLCGGGHVSAALAALLHSLDWQVTVQDDRPDFVTAQRFPTAERLCAPFDRLAARQFPVGTYFVVMTRGHQDDFACLTALLDKNWGYLGMIGSHAKAKATFDRLRGLGVAESVLADIHSPVGLSIGAQTPEEIAVSIGAQMIAQFRAQPLDVWEQPIADGLRRQTEPLVLATVLEKQGSAPRAAGARMLVGADGSAIGTVGGGAVEAAVLQTAQGLCGGDDIAVERYDLSNGQAATLGMICGGTV